MEWLIESIAAKLKNSANLACYVGSRVHHSMAPEDETRPYIVFHTNIGGGGPEWTYGEDRVESWDVQFDIVDDAASARRTTHIWELLRQLFEPPCAANIDSLAYTETASSSCEEPEVDFTTMSITRASSPRGPYKSLDGTWMLNVDYEFRAQAA